MENDEFESEKVAGPESQPECKTETLIAKVDNSSISSSKFDLKTVSPNPVATTKIEAAKPIELTSEELLQNEIARLVDIKPDSLKISDTSIKKVM